MSVGQAIRPSEFDEDLVLVERFLAGDAEAFQTLYHRYYDRVHAIARGVLIDPDEADDAVQEVFTLVYRNLHRFDRRARLSTWLFRIAVNRSIQQSRSVRYRQRNTALTEAHDQPDDRAVPPEVPDHRVAYAMERLAPADRALLTLFYWEDLSLQEIADSLGCGVNAAKTRLFRARERFRRLYEEAPE